MSNTTATAADETGRSMESTANNSFAARLKQYREAANLTLSQLAERANVSKTYLWELERGTGSDPSVSVELAKRIAAALSISLADLVGEEKPWCKGGGTIRDMRRPITEEWLIANGFRIETGRNDPRLPVRRLAIGQDLIHSRLTASPGDICIDVAPVDSQKRDYWFVWLASDEPYKCLHIRYMRERWELVRLYEALTGHVWPGEL